MAPKFIPPRPYTPTEQDTGAVFEGAVQYHNAANKLFETMATPPLAFYPMYFLYHHAVELALKACLLAGGLRYPTDATGHQITVLYECCLNNGLLQDNEDREMRNLVSMLESGNFGHRYRYAEHPHRHGMPDLRWVHDAVGQLVAQVEIRVSAWEKTVSDKRILPKRLITLGKPSYTKQPVPLKRGP